MIVCTYTTGTQWTLSWCLIIHIRHIHAPCLTLSHINTFISHLRMSICIIYRKQFRLKLELSCLILHDIPIAFLSREVFLRFLSLRLYVNKKSHFKMINPILPRVCSHRVGFVMYFFLMQLIISYLNIFFKNSNTYVLWGISRASGCLAIFTKSFYLHTFHYVILHNNLNERNLAKLFCKKMFFVTKIQYHP